MRQIALVAVAALAISVGQDLSAQTPNGNFELPPNTLYGSTNDLGLNEVQRTQLNNALRTRNFKKAEGLLIDEINLNPKSAYARNCLLQAANIFFLDNDPLNAAIAWSKADTIAPLDERNRFSLAMAEVRLNHPAWARIQLERVEQANPKNALYQYWLGRLDYDAQQYDSAIDRLDKAIQLDPGLARAYDTLGLCYDYEAKLDRARASFQHAVALNEKLTHPSPWPHLDYAILLRETNDLAEAERQLHQALGYDDRFAPAYYHLGLLQEIQSRYPEAIQSLEKAAALDLVYPEPHFALARIFSKTGRKEEAKRQVETYRQLKQSKASAGSQTTPSGAH